MTKKMFQALVEIKQLSVASKLAGVNDKNLLQDINDIMADINNGLSDYKIKKKYRIDNVSTYVCRLCNKYAEDLFLLNFKKGDI